MAATTTHNWLSLQHFTAFDDVRIDFSPGVNVLVGENGLGKTHVLKVLYYVDLVVARTGFDTLRDPLSEVFAVGHPGHLVRLATAGGDAASALTLLGDQGGNSWGLSVHRDGNFSFDGIKPAFGWLLEGPRPVFIPAIDMIGHARGFVEAYDLVKFDFDRTYRDIVNLLRVERRNGNGTAPSSPLLTDLMGGDLEQDEQGGFHLVTRHGRMPMSLVAEGQRRIATLARLQANGWLPPGAVVLWDEPEANLNPSWMGQVVAAILALARSGVQVFLATHSYVILKELDLQSRPDDRLSYHVFRPGDDGTLVDTVDDLGLVQPNAILDQYTSLYDREVTRATGRKRRGAEVD